MLSNEFEDYYTTLIKSSSYVVYSFSLSTFKVEYVLFVMKSYLRDNGTLFKYVDEINSCYF